MPFDTIGAFSVIFLYSILPSDKSGMHHNFALVMEAGFRHASTPRRRSFQRLLHPAASDKPFSDPALSISRSQMLHLHTYLYKRQRKGGAAYIIAGTVDAIFTVIGTMICH